MYYFVTNAFNWGGASGPHTRACQIEQALSCYADFPYQIIKNNFESFFKTVQPNDIVHIQSNDRLVKTAIRCNLPIIVGPNMQWQDADEEINEYENMQAVLIQRPDPIVLKNNPIWSNRLFRFPAFVNERFWRPTDSTKTIDVLTVGKSFPYAEYFRNNAQLTAGLQKQKIKHFHLNNYNPQQYRKKLSQTKVLAFPSPREAGRSLANAILEANMMNVPVIGLSSVLVDEYNEWHQSRGLIAQNVQEMIDLIPNMIDNFKNFQPRSWAEKNHGLQAGYNNLLQAVQYAENRLC